MLICLLITHLHLQDFLLKSISNCYNFCRIQMWLHVHVPPAMKIPNGFSLYTWDLGAAFQRSKDWIWIWNLKYEILGCLSILNCKKCNACISCGKYICLYTVHGCWTVRRRRMHSQIPTWQRTQGLKIATAVNLNVTHASPSQDLR